MMLKQAGSLGLKVRALDSERGLDGTKGPPRYTPVKGERQPASSRVLVDCSIEMKRLLLFNAAMVSKLAMAAVRSGAQVCEDGTKQH